MFGHFLTLCIDINLFLYSFAKELQRLKGKVFAEKYEFLNSIEY